MMVSQAKVLVQPLWIIAAIVLAGCAGQRGGQRVPPPEWVNSRPISGAYYIGIGSALNQGEPAFVLQTAKDRAAGDLASEIAVNVESASLLESAESNGQVSEHFSSSIQSHAAERIQGFEVVDVWQGPERTHVYYRLSKAKHAAERALRKQEAIASSTSEYQMGREALTSGNLLLAIGHWSRGIMVLEEFWNEVNRGTIDGKEVNLESRLVADIRKTISDIDIHPSVEAVSLNAIGKFKFPLGLHATIAGRSVSGVPIQYGYHNGTYRKSGTEFTDDEGLIVALISEVAPNRPDVDFKAEINLDRLWKQAKVDPTVVSLCGSPVHDMIRIPIVVEMPRVHVGRDPQSGIDADLLQAPLQAMRSVLMDEGYIIEDSAEASEFTILLNLRSEMRTPASNYGDFHTAYVEGAIVIRNANGTRIDEFRVDRTKGVQLNPEAALKLALSNTAQAIEKSIGKSVASRLR